MIDHLYIKRLAAGAGFDLCGIAPCRHLAENEALFRAWLARGEPFDVQMVDHRDN